MDRLAIIQGRKIVETTVGYSRSEKIETMARLDIIQGRKTVKMSTVGFST